MSEDQDKTIINPDGTEPSGDQAAGDEKSGKAGLFANKKLLLFVGGGLVVLLLAVVGTVVLMGGDDKSATADESPAEVEATDASHAEKPVKKEQHAEAKSSKTETHNADENDAPEFEDPGEFGLDDEETANLGFDLTAEEMSAIDQIEANLNFLDYDPADEVQKPEKKEHLSQEDSLEEADWLESEYAKLDAREKAVHEREVAVERIEKEVSRKLIVIEQAESSRIAQLAKLYDGMEPQAVAQLMYNLDDNTVVSIISRMKQKSASQLMAIIPPKRAARLSKKMITIAEN